MARTTAARVIDYCASQVGYREGTSNYNKYAAVAGHGNFAAWCATFLVARFRTAGQELPAGASTAGCENNCNAFKNAGRFSVYPAVGAIAFYGPRGTTHTGIVYKYDSTYIYTIEGNTNDNGSANGNGVYYRKRSRSGYTGSMNVYGYGYPNYSHAIVSADPAWGKTPQGNQTPPKPSNVPTLEVSNVQPGCHNSDVLVLQKALKRRYPAFDYSTGPSNFGPATRQYYIQWQRDCGVNGPYDGAPGLESLTRLATRTGLFKAAN